MAAAKFSIKTASSFFLVLYSTLILFFALPCFSDPDPLQDFCVADLKSTTTIVNGYPCKPVSNVTSSDFFYSGLMNEASTANPYGLGATPGDVTVFPGLNTQGLTINRLDLAPGGIVPLHTHPRASEANFVVQGEVLFGFITTTNVLYSKIMKAGELNIIPRGLVHFAKNVGPGKAFVLAILNSQLPGFSTIPRNLFGSNPTIPNDVLAKNFIIDESVIASIKSKFFSIKTASSFFLVLYSTMILFFTLPCFSDPDRLQDFCVADLSSSTTITIGYPCKPVSNVMLTALNTVGLLVIRVDLGPGGIVPFDTHPRASKASFVIIGEVLIGFISTSNVLYSKVVKSGEMSIVPRGLVHILKNVGPLKAVVLSFFNSQLPGTASIPNNLFCF
ncbi:hypothetical protein MKX01_029902 [Papaver californicum]|nr:hypothetical protein MKX01_029902 [Papaver californicum]